MVRLSGGITLGACLCTCSHVAYNHLSLSLSLSLSFSFNSDKAQGGTARPPWQEDTTIDDVWWGTVNMGLSEKSLSRDVGCHSSYVILCAQGFWSKDSQGSKCDLIRPPFISLTLFGFVSRINDVMIDLFGNIWGTAADECDWQRAHSHFRLLLTPWQIMDWRFDTENNANQTYTI